MSNIKEIIESGKAFLGIEFGSTRIKAVLIDEEHNPIASGSHTWENRYENGLWTYSLDDIWTGLQDSYRDMAENVQKEYGVTIKKLGAIGFSAMMHGYMAFDREEKLLVPFRTWRNTMPLRMIRLKSPHLTKKESFLHHSRHGETAIQERLLKCW